MYNVHFHASSSTLLEPVRHALDPLTADEIAAARQILLDSGRITDSWRFPSVLPVEPEKGGCSCHSSPSEPATETEGHA